MGVFLDFRCYTVNNDNGLIMLSPEEVEERSYQLTRAQKARSSK